MIHLVTDSTAGLPPEIKQQYDVSTISLKICVGDQTFDEDGGITQEAFFELLSSIETSPTTSQPSQGEFVALYEQLAGDEDEVISIHISEGLSGTIPNARAAAEQVAPDRISVVDSRTTSLCQMVMVIAAGEAVAAGRSRSEIVSMLESMAQESETIFVVDTLEYLHKGGRIGTASRLLGTLLDVKPILYVHEGKVEPLSKVRSSKKAIRYMQDEISQRVGKRPVRGGVLHIQARDKAESLAEKLKSQLNLVSLHIVELGPVLGSHTGPGVLAVAACPVVEDGA
jgi:DegV family protein with EDD domain